MNEQTKGEKFQESAKCKNNQTSSMSNLLWCDMKTKGNLLKIHDMSPNSKCKCQIQITFTPKHFQLDGAGFKNTMKKIFKRDWKNVGKSP